MRYLVLVISLLLPNYTLAEDHNLTTFYATVTNVVDGDTFDVSADLLGDGWILNKRVRPLGYDAPEMFRTMCLAEKQLGNKAKSMLANLILYKTVTLVVNPKVKDKFGRVIARVFLPDGTSLDHRMIKLGLGRVYAGSRASSGWSNDLCNPGE